MKNISLVILKLFFLLIILILPLQCSTQQFPIDYIGEWKTDSTKITVRKKIKFLKYQFKSSNITASLSIDKNQQISGKIGLAKFYNASIIKNSGDPNVNGISYIIQCGIMGSIFEGDSSKEKNIELWIKPITQKGVVNAEIRLKEGWDTFPMGEFTFKIN